jgi:hypothetical protein
LTNRVFKFPLQVEQRQMIMVPVGTEFVSVVEENQFPMLYGVMEVDEDEQRVEGRIIRGVTTGEVFNAYGCNFIDTVRLGDWFVFHVFEQTKASEDPLEGRFRNDYAQIKRDLNDRK